MFNLGLALVHISVPLALEHTTVNKPLFHVQGDIQDSLISPGFLRYLLINQFNREDGEQGGLFADYPGQDHNLGPQIYSQGPGILTTSQSANKVLDLDLDDNVQGILAGA